MSTPAIGPLIVMPQKVVDFQHARTCHAALCDILRAAMQTAVMQNAIRPDEAFTLMRIARRRDSGRVRASIERTIALTDQAQTRSQP